MNKILPIILVVVLSACAKISYLKYTMSAAIYNDDLTGSKLICKKESYLNSSIRDKEYIGEVFGIEFKSKTAVTLYTYSPNKSKRKYYKNNSDYWTLSDMEGSDDSINIMMDVEDAIILGINRVTLEAKIGFLNTGKIHNYGKCERNDNLLMEDYFRNKTNANKKI